MIKMAVPTHFHNKEAHVQGIISQKFGLKLIKETNKYLALPYFGSMNLLETNTRTEGPCSIYFMSLYESQYL